MPKLLQVSGVPFLRIKKPQSPYLSHVLSQKEKRKDRRWSLIELCDEEQAFTKTEDEWERVVKKLAEKQGRKDWIEAEGSEWTGGWEENEEWSLAAEQAKHGIVEAMTVDMYKHRKIGKRMMQILEQEQALFDQEKLNRQMAKSAERKARKAGVSPIGSENGELNVDSTETAAALKLSEKHSGKYTLYKSLH